MAAITVATAASACDRETVPTAAKAPEPAPQPAPAPEPGALWFGGDVHFGVSARSGLGDIAPSLAGAVGIVNLEGPISMGAGSAVVRGGNVTLQNPSDAPATLRGLGVGAVSVDNNHFADMGLDGMTGTLSAL